ncbi:MAG: hypothetical protein CL927_18485 [Deltaproteobacteria bacterium]|nr:hypothetical protein [Deltaproteobacteria bacterium]HCH65964.1 hypothetical protein [Deltaproteobacteria bacterium]
MKRMPQSLRSAPRALAAALGLATCGLTAGCSAKNSDSSSPSGDGWLASFQDLGPPRTETPSADLSDPSPLWFVAAHFLPGIDWDDPSIDIPLFLFDSVAMDPGVANPGSCPYEQLDANQTTWRSDCRSTQGYEWQGSLVQTRWTEGELEYTRWDSDLAIVPDIDDPEFDRLSIEGAMVYVRGGDGELERATQANVEVSLEGFWERSSLSDPREQAWARWAWTGRDELRSDGLHRIDGTAYLEGVGSVSVTTSDLEESAACPASPTGSVAVEGQQTVTLRFHGATDCRSCADASADGTSSEVCAL